MIHSKNCGEPRLTFLMAHLRYGRHTCIADSTPPVWATAIYSSWLVYTNGDITGVMRFITHLGNSYVRFTRASSDCQGSDSPSPRLMQHIGASLSGQLSVLR